MITMDTRIVILLKKKLLPGRNDASLFTIYNLYNSNVCVFFFSLKRFVDFFFFFLLFFFQLYDIYAMCNNSDSSNSNYSKT